MPAATLIGPRIRRLRTSGIAFALKQHPEHHGTLTATALVTARIRALRTGEVSPTLEQPAEQRRTTVAASVVRAPVFRFGSSEIAAFLERASGPYQRRNIIRRWCVRLADGTVMVVAIPGTSRWCRSLPRAASPV
jgi:hypothetical protein